jgi:hypothetical protein
MDPAHRFSPDSHPLSVYLNDHLMGATAGLELFRRAARNASADHREAMHKMAQEVARDREALVGLMERLDVPVRRYRIVAGWLGEKVGRLKFNGQLFSRARLSHLVEVEALVVGVRGKAAGWQSLRILADADPRLPVAPLDELIERADHQARDLEQIRRSLVVVLEQKASDE